MEKIIVIGSNSFSGAHFVDYALEQGLDVIGISRSPEPHPVFLPYKKRKDAHFRFFQCDLNGDPQRDHENCRGFQAPLDDMAHPFLVKD